MRAIIGGSGLGKIKSLQSSRREVVRTPYGDPSCPLSFGTLGDYDVVFLARHGAGHRIAPHEINYRANIWALKEAGVTEIIAVAAVGGIDPDLKPGALVVPDQLIDYTYGRAHTFFQGPDQPVTHIDFTYPYSASLRDQLIRACQVVGHPTIAQGTYGACQGPRLETAAEIRRLARDGCSVVGMTGMPEAALARELGLAYACLAVVVNPAAGVGASSNAISLDDISKVMDSAMAEVVKVLSVLGR
jgi:5'-deoxy-5'-methylthioadenosine phosphorylase